ncbi:pyridoxamine 5'-phosphate oxidase family protein [Ferruginibacter albus]|uniref:pyridoxamine 5'-phosphate oxidase family protein n=1 Tax=Ferruginibacter albus TaxID=2875540 RepID=UPI001CC6BBC4|nr:pyridoxamine 5'-phosphate oxidase family protein [Ferruginibacter albus]UAY53314.1 pyridoxamine 5'-phosphate oxidase family protein [Ferruginibacter albus]
MLTKDEPIEFVRKKIQDIKIAKFHGEINSPLPLPDNIINTLRTDEDGNILFFTSCNGHYAPHIDKTFYATLEYYHKGNDFYLHIEGKASIIEDEEREFAATSSNYDMILIKLKIVKAEYFENKNIVGATFKETMKNFMTELFFSNAHRQFTF